MASISFDSERKVFSSYIPVNPEHPGNGFMQKDVNPEDLSEFSAFIRMTLLPVIILQTLRKLYTNESRSFITGKSSEVIESQSPGDIPEIQENTKISLETAITFLIKKGISSHSPNLIFALFELIKEKKLTVIYGANPDKFIDTKPLNPASV